MNARANRRRDAAREAIMSRLGEGPARRMDLNKATGLVDAQPYLRAMTNEGLIECRSQWYVLRGQTSPSEDTAAACRRWILAQLADLLPHRSRELFELAAALGDFKDWHIKAAIRDLVEAGEVDQLIKGTYALKGAFPEGLPVSTRDPLALTAGESRALGYLIERLLIDQGLDLGSLETMADMLVATAAVSSHAEADALISTWCKSLISKGFLLVSGNRLKILRGQDGNKVRLVLMAGRGSAEEMGEDE
ncbi:MAG: hypothetical protein EKK55_12960 [Rhodocyclaceae bacterium]|nr:MAG: hypothetical protein EKK55_12960 [Rhodocyclaceae bacterium]